MNYAHVSHILGLVLLVLAGAQLFPLAFCFSSEYADAARGFMVSIGVTALTGLLLRFVGNARGELYRRDGVLIVVGAWLFASLSGAVPYVVSGAIPHPADALFESASGFTTTGASILREIEAIERPILFWRSFTQWLGGIGIIVLLVALLSELGAGARFLFKLEVPGPKAEVMHSRVRETAISLAKIYLGLTIAEFVLLLVLGLDLFDALTHTFSTVSTGGFSPYGDSVGHFSPAVQAIVMLFMLAAAVNFSLIYALGVGLRRGDASVLRDVELRVYLGLVTIVTGIVAIALFAAPGSSGTLASSGKLFLDAAFQVVSIITTTGFATKDFAQWPSIALALLVALMLLGGCAGSTAGGAKLVRAIIAWKAAIREVRLTFSPNSVIAVVVGEDAVPEESVRSVVGLLLLWVTAWGVGAILLAVGEADIVTAATASIATLSNVGPGLAGVGPTENFAFFASWQKLLMVVLMLLGRLEFFALLALFLPQFWRR